MFDTPDVKRQDCTVKLSSAVSIEQYSVNYEWLRLPIKSDHPFYNQIVDLINPSNTGSDVTRAIAAR